MGEIVSGCVSVFNFSLYYLHTLEKNKYITNSSEPWILFFQIKQLDLRFLKKLTELKKNIQ